MNDECGDVEGDRDGDGRLAWEGILGSIRTDQLSETYPIGSFQLFRNHTILQMSTPSSLSGRVIFKRSPFDQVGITRWDARSFNSPVNSWVGNYPSAQEVSRIQYWTSKINNIVKEICNIKSTFKNRKNNQNSPDKYGEDGKANKYFYGNNPVCHDQTNSRHPRTS